MAVFRVNKNANYTVMSNAHLRDKLLSLKGKGLLSMILSLPEKWDYSVEGLVAICKEDTRAVESALKELKGRGYVVVTKLPPQAGNNRYSYLYDIYEAPICEGVRNEALHGEGVQHEGLQVEGVQHEGVQSAGQLSTKQSSTDVSSTDLINHGLSKGRFALESRINEFTSNDELRKALKDYVDHRKQIKHALTEKALDLCLKKLEQFSTDPAEQIQIINQSIMQGWVGLFPLKQDTQKQQLPKHKPMLERETIDDWGDSNIMNRPRAGV